MCRLSFILPQVGTFLVCKRSDMLLPTCQRPKLCNKYKSVCRISLGVSGLSLAKDTLDKAVLECAPKPLPPTFKVPDIPPPSSICRLPMQQELITLPTSHIPVQVCLQHIQMCLLRLRKQFFSYFCSWVLMIINLTIVMNFSSQVVRLNTHFYHVSLCLDASSIPSHLRPYINLLREILLSTNLEEDDGTIVDYKHVVKMIQKETVSAGCGMGLSGGSPCGSMQGMFLFAGVSLPSREGYSKLCEWIYKVSLSFVFVYSGCTQITSKFVHMQLLFKTKFDESRVTTCIKNALQDITGVCVHACVCACLFVPACLPACIACVGRCLFALRS